MKISPPQITTSLVYWGAKKQVHLTLNINPLECKKNYQLKFDEVIVMQGKYKILQLEYVKTL
jgi:hypothetical protein